MDRPYFDRDVAHRSLRQAAVIGLPHPSHGEAVCAVLALKHGGMVSEHDVIPHCRAHLAAYKCLRRVRFLPDLSKGPTGKILKRALRDQAA